MSKKPFRFKTEIRRTAPKRGRRPISELDPGLYHALSEKFYKECARVTDPFQAAENIGCEVRTSEDGALEVLY